MIDEYTSFEARRCLGIYLKSNISKDNIYSIQTAQDGSFNRYMMCNNDLFSLRCNTQELDHDDHQNCDWNRLTDAIESTSNKESLRLSGCSMEHVHDYMCKRGLLDKNKLDFLIFCS